MSSIHELINIFIRLVGDKERENLTNKFPFSKKGSSAPRLAQAPTILKFPSLPARSVRY